MGELRWPVIIATAAVALSLFFGAYYYHQYYLQEAPLVEQLTRLEGVREVRVGREKGQPVVTVTPDPSYHGPLQDLFLAVEEVSRRELKNEPEIRVTDRRNPQLEDFSRSVTPALYEGARLGNYRSVAQSVAAAAGTYQVDDALFAVDYRRLYLQARDGDHYLYLVIPLEQPQEGRA